MDEQEKRGFEVIDRRGQKKEPREVVPDVSREAPAGDHWRSVAYLTALMQGPQGQIIVQGRACGLRSDLLTFVADWVFPPVWNENIDWCGLAKKRLDTFLGCSCTSAGACAVHKLYLPQWMQQDADRLNRLAAEPVPEVVEYMMRAEAAKRDRRIVPV